MNGARFADRRRVLFVRLLRLEDKRPDDRAEREKNANAETKHCCAA